MSCDKSQQNGHHRPNNMPTQKPSAGPKSTLANLLSSQRRSVAQSDRHRVQVARPFADNAFIEQAAGRAALIYSRQSEKKERGIAHQSSQNGSNQGSSTSNGRSTIPVQETIRVRFVSTSDQNPSRWGAIRPRAEPLSSAAQQKEQDKESSTMNPERKSILRQVERSTRTAGESRQRFITKDITSDASTTSCHQPNNSDQKENSLKTSYSNDSGNGTSITHVRELHLPEEHISRIMATNRPVADATPTTGNDLHSTRDGVKKRSEPRESGYNAQSTSVVEVHDPPVAREMRVKDETSVLERAQLDSPKSNVEYRSGPAIMQDSGHQSKSTFVSHDNTSWLKQKPDAMKKQEDTGSKRQDSSAELAVSGAPPKKKKTKDFSPFRVKVGCVVALRFRKLADGGNEIVSVMKDGDSFRVTKTPPKNAALLKKSDVSGKSKRRLDDEYHAEAAPQYIPDQGEEPSASGATKSSDAENRVDTKRISKPYEIWSPAIPGMDDGLSLLGSWIRCIFPKSFITRWQNENTNRTNGSPGRAVEGNVISILENDSRKQNGVTVCILVDRKEMKCLPYLQVFSDDAIDASLSSSEQKRRMLEAKIRGEDKVVVQVTLASIFDQRNGSKLESGVVSQWAVRKRVFAKPAGKKLTKKERRQNKLRAQCLFVGDGNDTQYQQEQNWRWIASRTTCPQNGHDMNHSDLGTVRDSMSQLVGEVVKMEVSPPSEGSTTLAKVTIKRLWTPEQIQGGRMAHHGPLELFDSSPENSNELYFQVPIEDLIVIGKRLFRLTDAWNKSNIHIECGFTITHSYQARDNIIMPLCGVGIPKESMSTCHHCQRLHHDTQKCLHQEDETKWCARCLHLNGFLLSSGGGESRRDPLCMDMCDSSVCYSVARKTIIEPTTQKTQSSIGQAFSGLLTSLQSSSCIDFTLPNDVGKLYLRPSFLPLTGRMSSKSYTKETKKEENKKSVKDIGKSKKRVLSETRTKSEKKLKATLDCDFPDERGQQVLDSLCIRAVPFDRLNKSCWGSSKVKFASSICEPFFREKGRPRVIKIGKNEEKSTLSGRAARANSRRMFKSLSALGHASKNVDRLAGRDREQQLRFDKSKIHGWGVYAEEPINMGDMIIEYRGEIIGNAVADKREKEYERAKMDDYMFRIDSFTVCDATISGNVARYINASCSPNCFTQIITAGENKRIVIYAKRDIPRGEELCYDYKFSYEHDQSKRIPCHCGSPACRGFMN